MIRYSKGIARTLCAARATTAWRWKVLKGRMASYQVFRPPVDHSVYEVDNRLLGSTDERHALLRHQVSWRSEVPGRCIVEFEHPFALVGHIDERTDYMRFRDEFHARMERFARWFDPQLHRLIATSSGAAAHARAHFAQHALGAPSTAIRVLHWGGRPFNRRHRRSDGKALRAFHYGGAYPWAKGTGDVIAVARKLPQVRFLVSADLNHPLFRTQYVPANVELAPFTSKRQYLRQINQCDLVLCPTYSDGWGVFLDAMARSLPIVAYGSYDKDEAVLDGTTGYVVSVPRELSLYEGFFSGTYRNWSEYNAFVADAQSQAVQTALEDAIRRYDDQRGLLALHGAAALRLFLRRHDGSSRVQRIREIYRELLGINVHGDKDRSAPRVSSAHAREEEPRCGSPS